MEAHLTDAQIDRTARGEFKLEDRLFIVRHLLRRCPKCQARIAKRITKILPSESLVEPSQRESKRYDAAFNRALATLEGRVEERSRLARYHLDCLPSGLTGEEAVEFLLKKSFEERFRNAEKMVWLAYWAKQSAESLDAAACGPKRKADIQARAWVEFANACRVADELSQAELALGVAFERYRQGTGDVRLLAQLYEFKASFLKDSDQFETAFELLTDAERLYRQVGEVHLAGRVLLGRGLYEVEAGMYSTARTHLAEGLKCLDPDRDPELQMAAQQNLILSLVKEGEFREAAVLLLASGLREKRADSPLWLLRLRWIEGMIQAGLGNDETAERAFEEARSGFFDQNLGINAARVSLELAVLWLRQGRHEEVAAVAREAFEKLTSSGVALEARRALSLLVSACEEEILSESMIDSVQDFLEQIERNPRLRFRGL